MARRLILDANGLRISRSGIDVVSPTGLNPLVFDGRLQRYMGLFASGVLNASAFVLTSTIVSGAATIYDYTLDVPFGKTFALPPIVLWMATSSRYSGAFASFAESDVHVVTVGGLSSGEGGSAAVFVTVTTTKATFTIRKSVYTEVLPGPGQISYLIAQA